MGIYIMNNINNENNDNTIDDETNNIMESRRKLFNNYDKKIKQIEKKTGIIDDEDDTDYYLEENEEELIPGIYGVSGNMNEVPNDKIKKNKTESQKKALELESNIIELLIRNKNKEAHSKFKILEKMNLKFNDDLINDIYFRVMAAMPKEKKK